MKILLKNVFGNRLSTIAMVLKENFVLCVVTKNQTICYFEIMAMDSREAILDHKQAHISIEEKVSENAVLRSFRIIGPKVGRRRLSRSKDAKNGVDLLSERHFDSCQVFGSYFIHLIITFMCYNTIHATMLLFTTQ